ncbi:MAG: type 4a pilus biogenesis protein PilO, partial [Thermoanaerobaculia bacterium]
PWYYALGVGVAIGALLLGLFFWFKLKPMQEEIAGLATQLGDLQLQIQEARAAERDLPQFRAEVRRLQLELDKLLRILPARRNTPDLLRRIRSLTEQGNFTLKRFTPAQQLNDRDFYSEWPIQVAVDGTYHNLALLFDKIGRFSRIINIEDLAIAAHPVQSEDGHTIQAEFRAKTFVYKEPAPAPEQPTGAAAGTAASLTPPPGG